MTSDDGQTSNKANTAASKLVRRLAFANQQSPPQSEGSYKDENQISPKLNTLSDALNFHMSKHGDTNSSLVTAVFGVRDKQRMSSLSSWRSGKNIPRRNPSLEILAKIELHYRLPRGYFAKLITQANPSYKKSSRNLSPFHAALNFQMQMHGDSSTSLANAVTHADDKEKIGSITRWKTGKNTPRYGSSFVLLERIEGRYQLPVGYFSDLIADPESATRRALKRVNPSLHSVYRWHLPADFESRPLLEQREITEWISANVLGCATEYGKYQRATTQHRFSIVFPGLNRSLGGRQANSSPARRPPTPPKSCTGRTIEASPKLAREMADLIAFKTAVLPPTGYRRYLRWESVTAQRAVRNYGILLGALAASSSSPAAGLGAPPSNLSLGLLIFPAVWDWYLRWRERRRGFFTSSERSHLYDAKGLLRDPTGWILQHPELANNLSPINGLVSRVDIAVAKANWPLACNKAFTYVCDRIPEMLRVTRIHRDPCDAILPVLNSGSPLSEYKKVADEILRQIPDGNTSPVRAALAIRSYLVVRFAMQIGIRQRNLRELLLCIPGQQPRTVRKLEELRRGEIRWDDMQKRWEIFIPAVAFKNAGSSFFKGKPFRLPLVDLDNLYGFLDDYVNRHRPILLAGYPDPGTFFVRSARSSKRSTTYDMFSFYAAWRMIIQRYGIYNPYTGRGAIAGLLPHGPHCVRDIIATHILKQTNSYELASFAIQDTVHAVMRHYSRYLPEEKAALAAEVVNRVWQA